MPKAQRKIRYPYRYLIIVTPLVGLVTYWQIAHGLAESRLANVINKYPAQTTATVTTTTDHAYFRNGPDYNMSYSFSVPGSNNVYNNTDFSSNPARSLNDEDYKRLARGSSMTGSIPIVYNRNDPVQNLTQFDIQTLPDASKIESGLATEGFLVWLLFFVPLGFIIRVAIIQNTRPKR